MLVRSNDITKLLTEVVKRVSEGEICMYDNGTDLYLFSKDLFDEKGEYVDTEYVLITLPSGMRPNQNYFKEYDTYYYAFGIRYKEVCETELDYVVWYLPDLIDTMMDN